MVFKNLTPHRVVLDNGGIRITFEKDPSIPPARVENRTEETNIEYEVAEGMIISMPVNITTRAQVHNLPEPQEGVIYIVSSMVANHVRRPDVVAPLTDATCERDESGRVISVKGFQTFAEYHGEMTVNMSEVAVTK